jgi:hypothetical protein
VRRSLEPDESLEWCLEPGEILGRELGGGRPVEASEKEIDGNLERPDFAVQRARDRVVGHVPVGEGDATADVYDIDEPILGRPKAGPDEGPEASVRVELASEFEEPALAIDRSTFDLGCEHPVAGFRGFLPQESVLRLALPRRIRHLPHADVGGEKIRMASGEEHPQIGSVGMSDEVDLSGAETLAEAIA